MRRDVPFGRGVAGALVATVVVALPAVLAAPASPAPFVPLRVDEGPSGWGIQFELSLQHSRTVSLATLTELDVHSLSAVTSAVRYEPLASPEPPAGPQGGGGRDDRRWRWGIAVPLGARWEALEGVAWGEAVREERHHLFVGDLALQLAGVRDQPVAGRSDEIMARLAWQEPGAPGPARLALSLGAAATMVVDPVLLRGGVTWTAQSGQPGVPLPRLSGEWRYMANDRVGFAGGLALRLPAAPQDAHGEVWVAITWIDDAGRQMDFGVQWSPLSAGPMRLRTELFR